MADAEVDAAPDPGSYLPVLAVPVFSLPRLDLLFVVEDGPGMLAKQQRLAAAIGTLTASFDTLRGGRPDLHIGVVGSDLGTSGSNGAPPAPALGACSGTGKAGALQSTAANTGAFISDAHGTVSYTGALADVLAATLQLGESGCDFPQPLAAMATALATPGFVRPNGNLAIVLVGDADDCSVKDPALFGPADATLGPQTRFRCFAQGVKCAPDIPATPGLKNLCDARHGDAYLDDVEHFAAVLNDLEIDPAHQILVATIGGAGSVVVDSGPTLSPACTFGAGETAETGVRLKALGKLMPEHAAASICATDDTAALTAVTAATRSLVGDPCIAVPLSTPPDCIVDDVVGVAHATIPACSAQATKPCWRLATDATACPLAQHLALVVDRSVPAAPGTVDELRCRP